MIIRQKRSLLQNSGGLLDYFEPKVKIDDVGGLKNLKMWLEDRKEALTPAAREFGIEAPKGFDASRRSWMWKKSHGEGYCIDVGISPRAF